jgi:hypothetical protein
MQAVKHFLGWEVMIHGTQSDDFEQQFHEQSGTNRE